VEKSNDTTIETARRGYFHSKLGRAAHVDWTCAFSARLRASRRWTPKLFAEHFPRVKLPLGYVDARVWRCPGKKFSDVFRELFLYLVTQFMRLHLPACFRMILGRIHPQICFIILSS
jgi:hypothetical protein